MTTRPNILFLMADDHAANAISAYGSRLAGDAPTPNLDRIASEGMRMDNCHCVNSICTPSRANILTGLHSNCNGVKTLADALPDDQVLVSELLRDGGYQTALFGKWHLHARPRGFDTWAVLPGQGSYQDPIFTYPDRSRIDLGTPLSQEEASRINPDYFDDGALGANARLEGYVTDVITDLTLDWLSERRDPQKPFFLCCHHKAPHDFFLFKQIHRDLFQNVEFREPDTLFEDEAVRREISRKYGSTVSDRFEKRNWVSQVSRPDHPTGTVDFSGLDFEGRARKAYQKYMQDYLRTVRSIDDNVGRLLDYLDEAGLADNTIVIYTSDQGMMLGEHDKIDKRWCFEESQRMPFLIRYPREIAPGSICDDVMDNLDFAPTFLDYAAIPIPARMQGRSARPLFRNDTPVGWRQNVYYRYWMHMAHHWVPAHYGIRTKEYKLVFFYGLKLDASGCSHPDCDVPTEPGWELYDLRKDPKETTNVHSDPAYTGVIAELRHLLGERKAFYGDTDENYPEVQALAERSACFDAKVG